MNRYERYKDSGIPWLGEVPEHWDKIAIHYLVNLKSGDSITALDLVENGEYPVFGGGGFRGYINSFTHSGQFNLIGRQGALCGNVTLANGKFFATEHAIVVTPIKKLDTKWLYYLLITMNLNQYSTSAAQPGISAEVIGRLRVPFPNFKEQTAITHYLDTKLGEIDALIDKQQTLLEKLAEQRTAVITQAVTKGLNPAAPMKNSGVEWLGDVPAHWDIVGISKLFMLKAGGDLQPDFFSREKDNEHCYPIYTNANDEHAVYGYTSKKRFNADSITVSGRGDIGFAVYRDHDFDAIIRLLVLSPLKKLDCKYYTYSINALLDFKFESSAVAQLSTVQLAQYKLLLPSYEEQAAIADYLDQETTKIDRLCETVNQTIGCLKEYRTALITQAVTGKIKVTNE